MGTETGDYRGWQLDWSGWLPLHNQDVIVSYWAAHKAGQRRAAVSPYPGEPHWVMPYDEIALTPLSCQPPLTIADRDTLASDKVKAETKALLCAFLDEADGKAIQPLRA